MAKDLSQFLQEVRFAVGATDDGQRLDHVLIDKVHWRSRTDIQSRIKRGKVTVDGKTCKPATRVHQGQEITVVVEASDLPDQDPASIELMILEENADLVALNKQAGLVVHPTGRHVYDTLMNALFLRYRENGEAARGVEPHVVHRLDRNTSGVIVVAKNFAAKRDLAEQFENRRTEKSYLALVEGVVEPDRGVIDADIGSDTEAEIRLKMKVSPGGLPSLTAYEVVARFADSSLVRVRPKTGRQHQIRVHLAYIGHPIFCDPLYGDPRSLGLADEEHPRLERQALHAESLRFQNPGDNHRHEICAPLALDMEEIRQALAAGKPLAKRRDIQSARWNYHS
ncbi:MAG: RluA family pseudouridine synthase [Planctomycetota bacterium]